MKTSIIPASVVMIALIVSQSSCVSSKKYKELDGSKSRLNENFKRSQVEVRDLRARTLTLSDELLAQEKRYRSYFVEIGNIRNNYKQDSLKMVNMFKDVDLKVEEFKAYKAETQKKIEGYETQVSTLNTYIKKQDKNIQLLSSKIMKERRLHASQKREIINRYERRIKNLNATIKSSNGI
ncbi:MULTISPECIES: hypothetical protein [unclassified Arcicella]|uniref:hypothetical protein n=1 Tax=unclassified Arcicella TaxID=2644986 RepID=UPI0028600B9B|nr:MULTISPECIES: hypothetical protein [unclassified Arcicella]MDR6561384.1 putative nuclease with TOPRIM domain [Arcicella sp. BE51]MDR6811268.1 putative nuclease with TOPRIM domain [Arcicella sp. BE140]MDR6822618.1 putative nuclease with TOPRIM domain [Arcicella sp. BE139]